MNRSLILSLALFLAVPAANASATMLLWLDATDFTAPTAALTTWTDKSGLNNHATAPSGREPSVVLSGINGQPAVQFDDSGAAAVLQVMITPDVPVASKNMHAFIVMQANDSGGHGLVYSRNGTTDLAYFGRVAGTSMNHGTRFDGAGADRTANDNVWSTTSAGLITSFISDDASGYVRINGGSQHTSPAGTTFGTLNKPFYIGALDNVFASAHHLDGEIGEIIVFDNELSEDERLGMEHILGQKWNLTGIPTANASQIAAAMNLFPGNAEAVAIPEPGTGLLALGGVFFLQRRRRGTQQSQAQRS